MDIKTKARLLRKNSTDAEQLIWRILRNRQFHNLKFRRQYPIKPYIVDFVCLTNSLIVEIDGGQHADQITYDNRRSVFLKSKGFQVIRFWNNEVLENLEGVYQSLTRALEKNHTIKIKADD